MRRSRPMAAVVAVLGTAMLASACLGPNQFDPTGRAPIGHLDVMADAGGSIRVSGWALDPETSASVMVKVGSEGVVHDVRANRNRPDVAAAYPGKGAAHGFEHTFGPLQPGLHGICVWVPNTVGGGDDRLLGCKNLTVGNPDPFGSLDTVTSLKPRTITVGGWAFDRGSGGSIEVAVTVDGKFSKRLTADVNRPDVGSIYRRSPKVGISTELSAPPGRHQVCVGMFNVGYGTDRLLGCRNVTVADHGSDRRPTGKLTSVVPLGAGKVQVSGTASDPDGSSGLRVRLDVDPGKPWATRITLPVTSGVFSTTIGALGNGLHTICPVGLDVRGKPGVTGDRQFICGTTVVGDVAVGTAGATSGPTWVAPPASGTSGSALRYMERDAGVSTRLSDGSTMWFFGDTMEYDQVGHVKYFVHNTAAWAAAGSPTVTRDGVDANKPFEFATPGTDFCAGSKYNKRALWPESAVTVPQAGGKDRVVVFMSKVCLGANFLDIDPRGMAVVEYTYDPLHKPVDARIKGNVTQLSLFPATATYGRAAVLAGDGWLYGYQCGRFPDEFGPCKVARVNPASLTTASAWRYWNGADPSSSGSWVADGASAKAMVVRPPAGGDGSPGDPSAGFTVPVAAFTLTYDAVHGVYLMVYTPWPGFTDRVYVRVATGPVGPWTEPVQVFLPGCGDTHGGTRYGCYAGTAQPQLSAPGLLGVGYYDQLISTVPARGQYVVVTVPFSVVLTPA